MTLLGLNNDTISRKITTAIHQQSNTGQERISEIRDQQMSYGGPDLDFSWLSRLVQSPL